MALATGALPEVTSNWKEIEGNGGVVTSNWKEMEENGGAVAKGEPLSNGKSKLDAGESTTGSFAEDSSCVEELSSSLVEKPGGTSKVSINWDDGKECVRGIHSLTRSVAHEASQPISEDDAENASLLLDQTKRSSGRCIDLHKLKKEIRTDSDQEVDDLEQRPSAARVSDDGLWDLDDGRTHSGHPQFLEDRHSEELRGQIFSSPCETRSEGEDPGGEGISHQTLELQQDNSSTSDESSGSESVYHPQLRSDSHEVSGGENASSEKASSNGVGVDAVSYLDPLPRISRVGVGPIQQSKVDSEVSLFYSEQMDLGEVINPYSLEERIRQAREDLDLALDWEVENMVDARLLASAPESVGSFNESQSDDLRSSMPELEGIGPIQPSQSAGAFERPGLWKSEIKERRRKESSVELIDEQEPPKKKTAGIGEAVLLGALASGVNGPTWVILKAVLVALIVSLVLLLHIASQASNTSTVIKVLVLFVIAGGLIVLLSWFVSMVGLVTVEGQMAELKMNEFETKRL